MKPYKYTKEVLESKVVQVKSYRQLILSFGLKYPSGGAHSHFKELVEQYQIDTSHFHGKGWNKNGYVNKPHTKQSFIKDVLCKNGKGWKSFGIKKKLFEFNLKEEKCENCLKRMWLNKPIPLELHHKDGDKTNNEILNLEILCPNCHALTNTYRGKNIKPL